LPAADRLAMSHPVLTGRERDFVLDALDSGWLAAGPQITEFEDALARITGSPHAVACVNGTAALHISLMLAGVAPGDLVIVPTLTFIATVSTVRYCSAEPVFLGSDNDLNLDPALLRRFLAEECERDVTGGIVERASGRRVAAVVPVHVFGNPCDPSVFAIADEFGIPVVEDAAESLGSSWTSGPLAGRSTGAIGVAGALSFNGNKVITTGGGGAMLFADGDLAECARYLINQAKDDSVRFLHSEVGYNYRFSNIHAAVGLAQLEGLPEVLEAKRANYDAYRLAFEDVAGVRLLGVPEGTSPNYWFYSLFIDEKPEGPGRDAVIETLDSGGIESRPLWYPNHLQKPFAHFRTYGVERSVRHWRHIVNIPCSADLTAEQIERVVDSVRRACGASV
jgi:perosamine synthetase